MTIRKLLALVLAAVLALGVCLPALADMGAGDYAAAA